MIAVGLLLFFQLRSILRNQTGIEDWIIEKAVFRQSEVDKKTVALKEKKSYFQEAKRTLQDGSKVDSIKHKLN